MNDRARVLVGIAFGVVVAGALVAACGDDIRCFAPDESACGIESAGDAGTGDADASTDSHGADVGADAEAGEGG